ncbi:MAG: PIG-L family deacetylase [Deltaproteobacteria bacterium]|nr:PIG-L family deacetylase [Deltaproteobacteria bacterium]
MSWVFPPARKVLAFAPHPDDEVFGCGGALALLQEQGAAVSVVVVTDGGLGGESAEGTLATIRRKESCNAAAVLGLPPPEFWQLADRGLVCHDGLVARLSALLHKMEPDLIFLPSPTELHPDHQALAYAGAEALRRQGGNWTVVWYEVGFPLPCPSLLLDISAVAEKKRQAMLCFHSQLAEQPYDERIAGLNRFRAYVMGPQVVSAEAFVLATVRDFAGELPALFQELSFYRRSIVQRDARIIGLEQMADQQAARIMELEQLVVQRDHTLAAREGRIVGLQQVVAWQEAQIADLYHSTSWRITAPLRFVATMFKKTKSKQEQ